MKTKRMLLSLVVVSLALLAYSPVEVSAQGWGPPHRVPGHYMPTYVGPPPVYDVAPYYHTYHYYGPPVSYTPVCNPGFGFSYHSRRGRSGFGITIPGFGFYYN